MDAEYEGAIMHKTGYFQRNEEIRNDGGLADYSIRQYLRKFYAKYWQLEEFQILNNSVVDFSIVTPQSWAGIEIKSSYDDVSRLEGQMNDYIQVFNRVIVITTKHLIDDVMSVLNVPKYADVGVYEARVDEFEDDESGYEASGVGLYKIRVPGYINHTKAHMNYVLSMTGEGSKLYEHLPLLAARFGIIGE